MSHERNVELRSSWSDLAECRVETGDQPSSALGEDFRTKEGGRLGRKKMTALPEVSRRITN
ncbi:hypothetical protein J6590_049502 [Homalodisca vitripennis]|nr:hypothetical protein J6590_049502 [Homalodisca vitripennis]